MKTIEYKLTRIVQKIPLFAGLTTNQLLRILQKSKAQTFGPDQCVFECGEIGFQMLILLEGKLVVTDPNGAVLAHIHPGEPAGELAVFTHETRLANVMAAEHAKVLIINKTDIDNLLYLDHDMQLKILDNLVELLAARLRNANQRISEQDQKLRQYEQEEHSDDSLSDAPHAVALSA